MTSTSTSEYVFTLVDDRKKHHPVQLAEGQDCHGTSRSNQMQVAQGQVLVRACALVVFSCHRLILPLYLWW